jgi:hypothetical protein
MPGKKAQKLQVVVAQPAPRKNKNKKKKKNKPRLQVSLPLAPASRSSIARRAAASHVEQLMLGLMVPAECPNLRAPTTDMPRTSVLTTRDVYVASTPTGTADGFVTGDMVVIFFGQPGRTVLVFSPGGSTEQYAVYFPDGTSAWTLNTAGTLGIGTWKFDTFWDAQGCYLSTGTLHGPSLALGFSSGFGYVFMDSGDTLQLTTPAAWGTATGTVGFSFWKYVGQGMVPKSISSITQPLTAGTMQMVIFGPTTPGYYIAKLERIDVTANTVPDFSGVTVKLNVLGKSTGRWHHYCNSDIDIKQSGDPNIGEDCRVVSASCLVTNTTSVMNAQGTVIAARVRDTLGFDVTAVKLGRMAEKYTGRAATGCYTFREFSIEDEPFTSCVTGGVEVNSNTLPRFDLDVDEFVHLMEFTNPNASTAPNAYEISVDLTIEFRTDLSRYNKEVSKFNYNELILARQMINARPEWFYENPVHMKDIYGFIKKVGAAAARGVQTIAPYAATAASAVDPAHSAGYHALAALLNRMHF